MPGRPPRICPVCFQRTDGSKYCALHVDNNPEAARSANRNRRRRAEGLKRLYDLWRWRGRRGTRNKILTRDPLCAIGIICGGRAPSVHVDHIIRAEVHLEMHGGDEEFFYDETNLRGACEADHSHKTALENAGTWDEALVPPLPPEVEALRAIAARQPEFSL